MLLTQSRPHPVGISARATANTSPMVRGDFAIATITPVIRDTKSSPWNRRTASWKLADAF
jgi:hypothetical protein